MEPNAEQVAILAKAGSDLKFLLDKEGVNIGFQVDLIKEGVLNIKTFAAIFTDTVNLRDTLKTDFGLGPAGDFGVSRR